jgi:hypothetical protein
LRERGQARQQDTVEQMKETKTRVDAYRRANQELGNAVKRDVGAWNEAKRVEKAAVRTRLFTAHAARCRRAPAALHVATSAWRDHHHHLVPSCPSTHPACMPN